MDVLEWLNQVRKLDQLIDAKIAERARLKAMATDISPKPMDGMPFDNTGKVSRKVEDMVIKLVDLYAETDKLIDQYVDHRNAVLNALEKLPPREYGVLHRYYIQSMTWEQVADDMGYCKQQVWRIKKNALKNLENVIECYPKIC